MTPGFRAINSSLAKVIESCIGTSDSKWTMVSAVCVADYHDHDSKRPAKQRRPMECVCLASQGEKQSGLFKEAKWCFDITGFLKFTSKPSYSAKGVVGM